MEEVVLKGDWFWQISLTLKGTKRIPYPLREYLDRKPELAALWREHVVEALEREGFQDNENGMFVNFAGNVRKLSEVMTILSKLMEDPWVKKMSSTRMRRRWELSCILTLVQGKW